jgi:probable HAF family extracellular repeat protein
MICALHLGALSARAQIPQYTVTDLGAFSPRRINDSAQVVGASSFGRLIAMLYREGVLLDITPPNGISASAWDINNSGDVVGSVSFCDSLTPNCSSRGQGFILRNNTYTILGTLGGEQSHARSINDSRQVTGFSHIAGQPPALSGDEHAFILQNGTMQDLGPSIGTPSSQGLAINATGQVAGRGNSGAFLFTNGSATFFEPRGFARDINNAGHVVGNFSISDDGSGRAFLFSGGVRQDLGTLKQEHTFSSANALNNVGQIVGVSSNSSFSSADQRAFIYSNGAMQDLNLMIPAGSGWVLKIATDINDAGQIVGNGVKNGEDRAFLLTPTQPMLMVDPANKAITVESVSFLAGPFRPATPHNLSADKRTRITLLTRNVDIIAGENIPPLTVEAEDSSHNTFALPVEFAARIPGASWLTQIIVRLPDGLTTGDLQIRVSYRGFTSNQGTITVLPNTTP